MRELRATFDLLYSRKRLLTKDLESINSSLSALQTKCDHEYDQDAPGNMVCLICGKKSSGVNIL